METPTNDGSEVKARNPENSEGSNNDQPIMSWSTLAEPRVTQRSSWATLAEPY